MTTYFLMINSSRGDIAFWEYDHKGVAEWELNRLPFATKVEPSDTLSADQITTYRQQIIGAV